jgi:hypothetical protein
VVAASPRFVHLYPSVVSKLRLVRSLAPPRVATTDDSDKAGQFRVPFFDHGLTGIVPVRGISARSILEAS